MLKKITIENFKNHERTEIALSQFTLLVGPNASGKTSVLEALELLSKVPSVAPQQLLLRHGRYDSDLRTDAAGLALTAEGETNDENWSFQFRTNKHGGTEKNGFPDHIEIAAQWGNERESRTGNINPEQWFPRPFLSQIRPASFLALNPKELSRASYPDKPPARLAKTGAGLANVLADMQLRDDGSFKKVVEDLKSVVPTVKKVHIRRAPVRQELTILVDDRDIDTPRRTIEERNFTGDEVLLDFTKARNIPAKEASDGTLIALGILTAIHTNESSNLILIDDIDHGLHPQAQVELVDILTRVLTKKRELQIVATTHSPYLIDAISPDNIWVFATNKDGFASSARLSEHPNAQKALEVLSPGEFFSSEDESWVLKRRSDPVE